MDNRLEVPMKLSGTQTLFSFFKGFWILTKPRLTQLVVLTALCGAGVAPGHLTLTQWIGLIFGTWGIVAAANVLNCVMEKDVDGLMKRTQERPLATGEMDSFAALLAGTCLGLAAIFCLQKTNHPLTAVLGTLGFFSYVALYTPLKRISFSALFVGAVPGAIPPMMGWSAVEGNIGAGAWILFGILFFWQLPHFIAIALNRNSEYQKAGLKTLPLSVGERAANAHMFFYTLLLVGVSLFPFRMGLAGWIYFITAMIFGIIFIGFTLAGLLNLRALNWSRIVFLGSVIYLPLVLGGWVMDLFILR